MQVRSAQVRSDKPRRRGLRGQRDWREQEREVRRSAVCFLRWLGLYEQDDSEAAEALGMSVRTLRDWRRRWAKDQMELRARGRRVERPDREVRRAILAVFDEIGPSAGLAILQREFPELPRAELVEWQRRYRSARRRRGRCWVNALGWHRAGSVWAMDHADAPAPIDNFWPHEALVRDLASSNQLAAWPVPDESARTSVVLLESLGQWHGYPLVLKVDNGPAFVSDELRRWAREHRVLLLYSPPYFPSYNGSIEAGVGSMKTRTQHKAARHDRPGHWTCDDVEAARLQANETARPWGPMGPTPEEVWQRRSPITTEERDSFLDLYRRHEQDERTRRGWLPDIDLQRTVQREIDRPAIMRTLIDQGFLSIRRRRITPPISKRFAAKIS